MSPSLEANLVRSLSHLKQDGILTPNERTLHDQCAPRLKSKKINPDNFKDIYSEAGLARDEKSLKKALAKEDIKKEKGELFEGILCEYAENSEWFGKDCRLVPLSEYDDRQNHGDFILEKKDTDGKIIRILIDATTSNDENVILHKLENGYRPLREDKLSQVKYFQSKLENFKGELKNVPKVVIGIDLISLRRLCDEICKKQNLEKNSMTQFLLINEMDSQLAYLSELAFDKYGLDHPLTKIIVKAFDYIEALVKEKKSLRSQDFEAKASEDRTYQLLLNQ
jgi:hypothetical protein